jgi:hypothetical protein
LNRNNLVPNQLQDTVHHRLKALQNLLVGEGHVSFFNSSLWKLCFNTDIHRPLLAIVSEVCLYSVFKVHDTLGVHFAGSLGSVRKFHLANLCSEDVGEVAVESC